MTFPSFPMASLPRLCFSALMILLCIPGAHAADFGETEEDRRDLKQAEQLLMAWPEQADGPARAKRIVDAVLDRNPAAGDAYRVRAMLQMNDGYFSGEKYEPLALERAERSVDQAIAKSPDNDRAYVLRSRLYRLTGRPERARSDLERAESLAADNPWMHLAWSDVMFAEQQSDAAAARCRKAAGLSPENLDIQLNATSCLIRYHRRAGRNAEAEKLHLEMIGRAPTRAWLRGNYAGFLECMPQRYDDAAAQAKAALMLMDYGVARLTLAVALYRRWAAQVLAGQQAPAESTWNEARRLGDIDVAALLEKQCGGRPLHDAMLALRATGRARLYTPAQAIPLAIGAHENGGRPLPGVFRMEVQATGRGDGNIYLNSMPDFRDPRCLTVRFGTEAQAAFRKRYGVDPDVYYKGKTVTVVGGARRIRIEVFSTSLTAENHYFQTQIDISDPEQIKMIEDMPQGFDKG
jgi:Tfp pilus assembly protein PilF